jgi:hypothetical protein
MKTNPKNPKKEEAIPQQDKKGFLKTAPPLLLLPSGTKFNDVYMDASDVAIELKISKRLVRNMRASGKLSYTNPFGKIWYFRQEIAEILEANKKQRRM